MTREEKLKRLSIINQQLEESRSTTKSLEEGKNNLVVPTEREEYEQNALRPYVTEEGRKELTAETPGFMAGYHAGVKASSKLPIKGIPGAILQQVAGIGSGMLTSPMVSPYIKPYTDSIYDTLTDPKNVLSLGDDFKQGVGSGAPSVIDNTLVPYETVDSSSTGVMNYAPQLR